MTCLYLWFSLFWLGGFGFRFGLGGRLVLCWVFGGGPVSVWLLRLVSGVACEIPICWRVDII